MFNNFIIKLSKQQSLWYLILTLWVAIQASFFEGTAAGEFIQSGLGVLMSFWVVDVVFHQQFAAVFKPIIRLIRIQQLGIGLCLLVGWGLLEQSWLLPLTSYTVFGMLLGVVLVFTHLQYSVHGVQDSEISENLLSPSEGTLLAENRVLFQLNRTMTRYRAWWLIIVCLAWIGWGVFESESWMRGEFKTAAIGILTFSGIAILTHQYLESDQFQFWPGVYWQYGGWMFSAALGLLASSSEAIPIAISVSFTLSLMVCSWLCGEWQDRQAICAATTGQGHYSVSNPYRIASRSNIFWLQALQRLLGGWLVLFTLAMIGRLFFPLF